MRPKTSIELGINKAISTDLQLCLDLARNLRVTFKNNNYVTCTHIIDQNNMSKFRL